MLSVSCFNYTLKKTRNYGAEYDVWRQMIIKSMVAALEKYHLFMFHHVPIEKWYTFFHKVYIDIKMNGGICVTDNTSQQSSDSMWATQW